MSNMRSFPHLPASQQPAVVTKTAFNGRVRVSDDLEKGWLITMF